MNKFTLKDETINLVESNPITDKTGKPVRADQSHFVGSSTDDKVRVEVVTGSTMVSKTAKRTLINVHVSKDIVVDEKASTRDTTVHITCVGENTPAGASDILDVVEGLLAAVGQNKMAELVARVRFNAKGSTSIDSAKVAAIIAAIRA